MIRKIKKLTLGVLGTMAVVGSCYAQPGEKAVYMVSNAHFDSQWNWDVQTSIKEYVRNTLTQNLWLLERYPNYVFNFEGGIKYKWMKEYYPQEYAKIKEYIKNGRWHISGASWDATDPNMPSPESFFRNILLGQEYYKKEFGVKSTDIFLPDCFGFGYTLPTVAAHCGLIGFSTQKLEWRQNPFHGDSKVPFEVGLWEGVDGSRIMAAANARNYTKRIEEGSREKWNNELVTIADKSVNGKGYRYYGTGDIGGSPTVLSVEAIENGVKGDAPLKIVSATSDQLFKEYLPFDKHPELPVYKGELLMDVHATGCYTSQAAMKLYNRRNEQLGDAAEKASVMAEWLGGYQYPQEQLTEAWRRFIWHQFHDDLTGTSIPKAYAFSWNDEILSQTDFNNIIHTASASVASAMDTRVKGTPVVVYNSLAQQRSELVHAFVPMNGPVNGVEVIAPSGKKVNAQLVGYKDGKAEIVFTATVPSSAYSVYDVRKATAKSSSVLKATDRTIENSIYKVTLDNNGDICSIVDKRNGKELVEKGKAFGLALFTENKSFEWPAWEVLKATMDAAPIKVDKDVKIYPLHKGASMVSLRVERKFGDSRFCQTISLTNGATDDRIDIEADIDWKTTNALLKAEFPMAVSNSNATYDLGIGSIQRGNNTKTAYEVYAQQWADITAEDNSYGVTVINNCKYGWDKPNDNTLRLTLLHTPMTERGYKYQDHQDIGHHTMKYSIVGHTGKYTDAAIVAKADAMNNPLFAFVAQKHAGALGKEFSMMNSNNPDVAIKVLKRAEDGNSYVVRLYETAGKESNATITFPSGIISAKELNGIEEVIGDAKFDGNKLSVSVNAFAPKTFCVTLAKSKVAVKPIENKTIALPYNLQAFTNDAFAGDRSIDNHGNSYSYDLLPETIVSQGIEFKHGEFGRDNAVRCDGQTIELSGVPANGTLYLLVASTSDDRKAEFSIDNKPYSFMVPYFSGFYAQWNYDGKDGYIKDANPVYVGSHIHNRREGNKFYEFGYMYQIAIPVNSATKSLTLPKDKDVVVFAATISDSPVNNFTPANEFRAIPKSN